MGKTLAILGVGLFSLATPPPALAQVPVTLQLRDGARLAGALIDLSAVGFTIRTDGRDRRLAPDEVIALEFVPGSPDAEVRRRLGRGVQVVVLRSGHAIEGRLVRIRGSIPLRITVETPDGSREVTSHEIAQVFLAPPIEGPPPDLRASPPQTPPPPVPSATEPGEPVVVNVQAGSPWTDSGLIVGRGEHLLIRGTGVVRVSAQITTGPEGIRAATSETSLYPVAGAPVGALIARVGNGTPFVIDEGSRLVRMPNAGRLMLGVNDDNTRDNSGAFVVTISRSR